MLACTGLNSELTVSSMQLFPQNQNCWDVLLPAVRSDFLSSLSPFVSCFLASVLLSFLLFLLSLTFLSSVFFPSLPFPSCLASFIIYNYLAIYPFICYVSILHLCSSSSLLTSSLCHLLSVSSFKSKLSTTSAIFDLGALFLNSNQELRVPVVDPKNKQTKITFS